ncbi:MAG: hypothetical protein FWE35_17575 [Streptosporangiales bacterium]|nr:hypothetical protein [Streptosporangiales bacterium]
MTTSHNENDRQMFAAGLKAVLTAAAGAAITVLLLAGCSAGPTVTQEQAAARVNHMLTATGASITPRPRLVTDKAGTDISSCVDEAEGQSDARVQAVGRYLLRGIPEKDNPKVAKQVLRYWTSKGYAPGTFRMDTSNPQLNGSTKDGYLIALDPNNEGQLSIVASSPCVWPHGTPPPQH